MRKTITLEKPSVSVAGTGKGMPYSEVCTATLRLGVYAKALPIPH